MDAIVLQSAARRGDDVYTGDADDLEHLSAHHTARPVAIVSIAN